MNNEVIFDLQRFAEEGKGAEGGGEEGKDPGTKFKEIVDPVTKKAVKVPAEFESVLGHFISTTRSQIEGQFKPLLEKLESENAEIKDIKVEYERLKEQSMSAEERAQANAKKKIEEHEVKVKKAVEEASTWKTRFEKTTIRNDILSSFGDIKLCNPAQVALLFENEGKATISELVDDEGKPTGIFETKVSLVLENDKGEPEKIEGTPTELFKKWIKLDRNLHHIHNDVMPGSGNRGKGNVGKVDPKLTPVERMNQARNITSK